MWPREPKYKSTHCFPTPGIEPGPRRWKRRILTTRPCGMELSTPVCNVALNNRSTLTEAQSTRDLLSLKDHVPSKAESWQRLFSMPVSPSWLSKVQETVAVWDFSKESLNPNVVKTTLWDKEHFVVPERQRYRELSQGDYTVVLPSLIES